VKRAVNVPSVPRFPFATEMVAFATLSGVECPP
jgi:hypothetical protein